MEEVKLNQVYLSIGSNKGDRLNNIQNALELLNHKIGSISKISSVYENPPIGFESEMNFYNLCVELKTFFNPFDLLDSIKKVEKNIGRSKKTIGTQYSNREIDIDIILYENNIIETEILTIPHKLFRERKFVLKPLSEIAKNKIDPVTLFSIDSLYVSCMDESELNKIVFKIV